MTNPWRIKCINTNTLVTFKGLCQKINSEIWEAISKVTKIHYCSVQKTQKILLTAMNALCSLISECAQRSQQPVFPVLLRTACDATGLLLKANHDINMSRRGKITEDRQFNYKYKHLKNAKIPVSDLLWSDLKSACATIETQYKINSQFQGFKRIAPKRYVPGLYQPYRRRSGDYQPYQPRAGQTYAGMNRRQTFKRSEK